MAENKEITEKQMRGARKVLWAGLALIVWILLSIAFAKTWIDFLKNMVGTILLIDIALFIGLLGRRTH